MTNEELFELYRQGDKKARDRLITQNIKFIKKIAARYHLEDRTDYEFQDLIQIGVIGLMKAIEKYNPAYGTKFITYAKYWIQAAIGRALMGYESHISLQMPLSEDENITLEDTIEDPKDYIKDIESQVSFTELAQVLKEYLTETQYKVYILKACGYTMQEIANKCGITPEQVKQELQKGLRKLLKPKIVMILKKWLDERTTYYKSPDYSQPRGGKTYKFGSTVEWAVMQREKLIETLAGCANEAT